MKRIKKIVWNYFPGSTTTEDGENYCKAEVGINYFPTGPKVKEITCHWSEWKEDKCVWDIIFEDKTTIQVFNPNEITTGE